MYDHHISWPDSKDSFYHLLFKQVQALLEDSPSVISSLANVCALLNDALEDISWCGFYLTKGNQLILGPFQGKTACTVIPFGKGVCGTAAKERATQLVPDVHAFPGHIACDSATNSEIVVPVVSDDVCIGVLDIDSDSLNRFDQQDAEGLEEIIDCMASVIDWHTLVL